MTTIQSSKMNKKSKQKIKTFPHPIDSGWSWMVLLATFTIFVTFGGILRSFGIYMVEFLSVYSTDSTSSSLIIGLQFASSGIAAIIGMTVGFKFLSPRQVIMIGGLIGSIGLFINTFAKSIYFFIFSHGILVGCAIGLLNGPSLYSLGKYFDKRRSLANGVTMSGVSFGGLVLGPLSRYLIDQYGLRGAFLITGGLHLHTLVAGALIRPETFYQIVIKKKRKRKISDNKNPNLSRDQRTRKLRDEPKLKVSNENRNLDQIKRKISDSRKPETQSLLDVSNEQLDGFRPRSNTSDSFSPLARKAMFQRMRSRTESEVVPMEIDPSVFQKGDTSTISTSQGDIPSKIVTMRNKRPHYISSEFLFDISTVEIVRSLSEEKVNKQENGFSSSLSVMPQKNSLKTFLRSVFNCAIFKNPAFTIFLIAFIVGSIGCFYPIVFIPALGDQNGIDKIQTSLLVSVSSAVDIFGRAGSGIIADRGFISRKQIMIIALTICGVSNCLNSFYIEFWSLAVFSVIYGLIGGTIFAINTSTLSEVIEPEQLGQAVGIMVGLQQLCLGIAGPLTGALRDLTGTYSATFYFFGAGNLFGACLLFIDMLYLFLRRKTRTTKNSVEIEIS